LNFNLKFLIILFVYNNYQMNFGSFFKYIFKNTLQYFDLEFLYNTILKQNFNNKLISDSNDLININPQGIIFDMDGVLRIGENMTLYSDKIINYLNNKGIKNIIITNESRKSPPQIHDELIKMRIDISIDNLYTSIYFMIKKLQNVSKEYDINIGLICSTDIEKYITDSLITDSLITDSLNKCNISISNEPIIGKLNIIVIGEIDSTEYDNKYIDKLKNWLSYDSKIYITTPDITVPDIDGWISPTNIIEKVNNTSKIDYISGKPNKDITYYIQNVFEGIDMNDILFVGDNIDTDIKMSNIMGTKSLLLSSGVTSKNQLNNSDIQPDYILESIQSLYILLTNKDINTKKI